MTSRQYVQEAWRPVTVRRGGQSVVCNFNPAPGAGDATLCIIPTQAREVVEDPVGLRRKPNVMSQWLDRLTAAGAGVLLVHGEWFDNLRRLAADARDGRDGFARWLERMGTVVDHAVAHGYGDPGRFVAMGSSRHGFAVLHAMANIPGIAGGVAHQPVVWWPRMEEFRGMDDNAVVLAHSLYALAERFPPRPVLVQTGYNDERVGQDWLDRAARRISEAYRAANASHGFTHELMDIPGHDGTRIPTSALDSVVTWMREQRLVQARYDGEDS